MRRMRNALAIITLAAGIISTTGVALANPVDDVMQRARPEYDAKGLPMGGFRMFPDLTVGATYDDNVYRQSTAKRSDVFYTINPSVVLKSEWSRHMLELHASSDTSLYSKQDSENTTDWNFGGAGQLDVLRSFHINVDGDYSQLHEQRSSPDLPGFAKEPTQYSTGQVNLSAEYQPNRFGIAIGGGYDRFDYDPTALLGGGFLNNKDRDRDVYTASTKLFYEFSPGYSAYVSAGYNDRKFDLALDRSGYNRSSHGYRVNGGLDMMLGHLVKGEIYAGYLKQQYHTLPARPLPDVSGMDYGASLDWYATQLTTVRLSAARTLNDTTLAGAAASDDRSVGLAIDHELLRNVILHAHVNYTDSKFQGITRNDKFVSAGVGADYMMNRYLSVQAKYTYQHRNSNIAGQDYSDNMIFVGITGHL